MKGHKEASSAGGFLQRDQGAGCPWEAGAVGSPAKDRGTLFSGFQGS